MAYCCIPGCKSVWRNGQAAGISLHEIPANLDRREKWLKVISRKNWTPLDTSNYSRVCSLHFQPSDFKVGTKRRMLLPTAVPSVFPTYPKYMQPIVRKLRTTVNSTGGKGIGQRSLTNKRYAQQQSENANGRKCEKNGDCQHDDAAQESASDQVCKDASTRYVDKAVQIDSSTKKKNLELRRWKNKYYHVVQKNKKLLCKFKDSRAMLSRYEETQGGDIEKYKEILRHASLGLASAVLLREQVNNFRKKRPSWCDGTIRRCIQWRNCSRKGYAFALNCMLMKLPSRFTLSRFADSSAAQHGVSGFVTRCLQAEVSKPTTAEENRIPEANPSCDIVMVSISDMETLCVS